MKHVICALLLVVAAVSPASSANNEPQGAERSVDNLLISKTSMESLTGASLVTLDAGRTLNLEPGVRVTRVEGGYLFATHSGKQIELAAGTDLISLPSPTMVQLTPAGWAFNDGRHLDSFQITARRAAQDDTDSNLKSMQESAKKLKAKSDATPASKQPNLKLRLRRLFGDDPMPTAELFNKEAIQQLTHLSPIGF